MTQQETDDARYKLAADQQAVSASESQARALLAKLDGQPEYRGGGHAVVQAGAGAGGGGRTRDEPLGRAGAVSTVSLLR